MSRQVHLGILDGTQQHHDSETFSSTKSSDLTKSSRHKSSLNFVKDVTTVTDLSTETAVRELLNFFFFLNPDSKQQSLIKSPTSSQRRSNPTVFLF